MRYVFHTLIVAYILLWTGCSDKKSSYDPMDKNHTDINTNKIVQKIQNDFVIRDIDNRSTTISFIGKKIKIKKVVQPIIAINIFANWSAPSRGMIPYLSALQQKYSKDLFVISILTNSDMNNTELRTFMKKHSASHFISNTSQNNELSLRLVSLLGLGDDYPIPLTIIFKNGEYNTHYIGATPIEMISSDIEQLRRK